MLKGLNKKIPKSPKKSQKPNLSTTPTDPKEKILNE
jgi:hypothetical protein